MRKLAPWRPTNKLESLSRPRDGRNRSPANWRLADFARPPLFWLQIVSPAHNRSPLPHLARSSSSSQFVLSFPFINLVLVTARRPVCVGRRAQSWPGALKRTRAPCEFVRPARPGARAKTHLCFGSTCGPFFLFLQPKSSCLACRLVCLSVRRLVCSALAAAAAGTPACVFECLRARQSRAPVSLWLL